MPNCLVPSRSNWLPLCLLGLVLCAAPTLHAQVPLKITSTTPLPAGGLGVPYNFQFTAINGLGSLSWIITDGAIPNLTLSEGGLLSGIPQTAGVFQIQVQVIDAQERHDVKTFQIAITAPIRLPAAVLPSGTVGVAYTYTFAATGGAGTFTYLLSAGSVPPGLTMQPNGVLTGTPTVVTTTQFFLRVTDTLNGILTAGPFTITINAAGAPPPPPPPPNPPLRLVTSCPALPFPAGGPVDIGFVVSGGEGEYSIKVTNPSWLSYQPITGRITGTPPSSGSFVLTVVVSDAAGAQTTTNCGFTVGQPLTINNSCPANLNVGVPFRFSLSTQDGQGPYNWVVNSPSWIKALTNGQATADFGGTPPVGGTVVISITVTDSIRSKPFTFTCTTNVGTPALAVRSAGCPTQTLLPGSKFSLELSVSGGAGDYRWSLTPPSTWLSISSTTGSTITLSGTVPDEGGAYPVTITVSDSAGATATALSCTLQTVAPLMINGKTPEYTAGQAFTTTLTVTGGLPPYNVTINGPSFTSISLNGATITFTGTPANTDPFTCTISATDRSGLPPATFNCSGHASFPTLVVTPVQSSSGCPANPIIFGQNFAGQLQATGGDGKYTWTFTGPDWLKTSQPTAATFALTGTPDRVQDYSYSVQVRDGSGTTPAQFSCTLHVNPPNIPTISLVVNLTTDILQPANVVLTLNQPAPSRLDGHVLLSFASTAAGPSDNLQVQFLDPAAVNRSLAFTIPQGATSVTVGRIQPGTVSGTITVAVTDLTTGGVNVLTGRPQAQSTIPKLAPVLTDVSFDSETNNGFTIVVTGYSTPRDASSLSVTFTARSGAKLSGNSTFSVTVSDVFTPFFSTSGSALPGSTFFLRVPVTINGNKNDIGGVSVQLTNSAGQSNTLSKSR